MNSRYVFVDLDGTLLAGDTFVESLIGCVRSGPKAWRVLASLQKGVAARKQAVSVFFDPDLVSVREEVVALIESERAQGARIVLATGAPKEVVDRLTAKLPAFDAILCTTSDVNRVGAKKLVAIQELTGSEPFAYLGNSLRSDRSVWAKAAKVYMVGSWVNRLYWRSIPAERRGAFIDRHVSIKAMFAACRPEQWMKNVLVFLPLLAAHVWVGGLWLKGLGGFLAFSFVCSAVYLVNDLLDKPFDRVHQRKSTRPIAAGDLETTDAIGMVIGLGLIAAALIIGLGSMPFFEAILIYVVTAFLYSLILKRVLLVDVFVLTGLYILRLLAGAGLTGVPLSAWLLGVSLFAFSSLAFLKRFSSLQREEFGVSKAEPGRGYVAQDRQALGLFGVVSAFSALVMLCLYMQSDTVFLLYQNPMTLYLLIPLLFFLLARVWLLAYRGEVQDDPVAFFLHDKTSYLICVLGVACVILSS